MRIPLKQISGMYDPANTVWGSFYSTEIQTNASTTATNSITFNNSDPDNYNVAVVGSQVSVGVAGVYNIQFSTQIDKTDSNEDDIELWLAINGNDVANSNTRIHIIGNAGKFVAAWNFVVKLDADDYIELRWYSADIDMRLYYEAASTNPSRPAIPSVILTVTRCL